MKTNQHIITFLLLLSIGIIGCKKNKKDKEKPSINAISLSNSSVEIGNPLLLNAQFFDNQSLGSYKIVVANLFGFTADSVEETERFSYVFIDNINETEFNLVKSIGIPVISSAGPYVLTLSLLDAQGNSAKDTSINFEITNSIDQPILTLTTPVQSSIYNINDSIVLMGTVMDDKAIGSISFATSSPNGNFNTQSFLFDTVVQPNWNIQSDGNVKVYLPSVVGDYELKTQITDTSGNMKRLITNFTVN